MEINNGTQLLGLIHDLGLNCNQFSKVLGCPRSSVSLWTNGKRTIPKDVTEHALLIRWAVNSCGVDAREIPALIRAK